MTDITPVPGGIPRRPIDPRIPTGGDGPGLPPIGPLGPFDTEITGFSPGCGLVGTVVTISVSNFGIVKSVSFNNEPATEFGGGVAAVVARVSPGATTGKIAVTDTSGRSAISKADFVVTPESGRATVTGFNPVSGTAGMDVMVFGTNLSAATQVTFGGQASSNFRIDNDNQITAKVPAPTPVGQITVTTKCGGSPTSRLVFNGTPPRPRIMTIDPPRGRVGEAVTITGTDFNFAPRVTFTNGIAAPITAQSATSLTVTVPAGAVDGPITVTTAGGSDTSGPFDVLPPAPDIRNRDGFTPTMGAPGTEVLLFAREGTEFLELDSMKGVNFKGPNPGQRIPAAKFEVLRDPVTRRRDRIKAIVPMMAVTGPIRVVDVNGGTDSTGPFPADFVVLTGAPIRPNPASNLTATVTQNKRIRLQWQDNSDNETGFRIERTSNGDTAIFSAVANATTLVDETPMPNVTYCYTVIAFNGVGDADPSNTACATVGMSATPVITSVVPSAGSAGATVDISGSNLDRIVRVLFNGVDAVFTATPTLIRAVVPTAATSGPLTLAVNDGTTVNGPIFTIATGPAAPSNVTAAVEGSQIRVSWSDNSSNETGFKLERRTGFGAYEPYRTLGANVTTFLDGGVIAGVQYCYRLRSFSASGDSPASNEACATVTAASAPTITSFAPPSGPVGTPVSIRGTNLATSDTVVLFNQTEAAVQIVSQLELIAIVPQGATTGPIRVTTSVATAVSGQPFVVNGSTTLAAPSNLTASPAGTQVSVSWTDNSGGESGFKVERRPQIGLAPFAPIGTTGPNVTTFVDPVWSGLYSYRVKAFDASGESAYSNVANVSIAQPGLELIPNAPSNLVATVVGSRVAVSWTDNSAVEQGFRLERSPGASGAWATVAMLGTNVTNFLDGSVLAGATYGYRVLAFNANGDSPISNTASVTVPGGNGGGSGAPPAAPSNLVAISGPLEITLQWNDNSGDENGFRIERSVGTAGFEVIATTGPNQRSYLDAGLVPTLYNYRLKAFNAAGESAYSNEVSARPGRPVLT